MNVNCDEVRIDACNVNADYVVVVQMVLHERECVFLIWEWTFVDLEYELRVWTGSYDPQSVLQVSESHLQDIFYSIELICIA